MSRRNVNVFGLVTALLMLVAMSANGQSFRVQCPTSTITHPDLNNTGVNNSEPAYTGPTAFTLNSSGYNTPTTGTVNGAIKCQQVSGGDGYSTMANGTQTFMFAFGPLSGLADIAAGLPGTESPAVFNKQYPGTFLPGDPATTDGVVANVWPATVNGTPAPLPTGAFQWNGAVGLIPDIATNFTIYDINLGTSNGSPVAVIQTNAPNGLTSGATVFICGTGTYLDTVTGLPVAPPPPCGNNKTTTVPPLNAYDGQYTITVPLTFPVGPQAYFPLSNVFTVPAPARAGLGDILESQTATISTPPTLDGHVDPRQIMDIGVMNGSIPAPLVAMDEDDETFLTLTNVGMIMRPDLFEQHTIHFHGYPNASSVYDGVPDASVAINIGGSFTYYYLAPDAGTYFWHCHITPPEHLQMGMVGQLYVRPRQNRVPLGGSLYTALQLQNGQVTGQTVDLRTVCNPAADILCSAVTPSTTNTVVQGTDKLGLPQKYVYNDGDGSTAYDVEYPLQIHGFDPNFHFVGMTFNPEAFAEMKDKFFLLNGRSYPDTVTPGPMATQSSDGRVHYSQPLPAIINIPVGGKALLRIADLDVTEYQTLASLGVPMKEVGFNAKLLRDQTGNNMAFYTNSITLGGGESLDVILDASDAGCGSSGCAAKLYPAGSTFYLYTPQLDHLSNDQENFGGLMTEVHICNSVTSSTYGNTCN